MPPKVKITQEEIVDAAVDLIRRHGRQALNARRLAAALGCSTQPLFSNFGTMDDLMEAVLQRAMGLYRQSQADAMARGDMAPYKASGMAYIRFAAEEKELFRLLFMRSRRNEAIPDSDPDLEEKSALLQSMLGLSPEDATFFHVEMWVCVHGIAAMIATDFLPWRQETVSRMLTDQFNAMRDHYLKRRLQTDGGH